MSVTPVRIFDLPQFVDEINRIEVKSEIRFQPNTLLFRGHSDHRYTLVPSLGRRPSEYMYDTWQREERYLVETAQQKFPTVFTPTDYPAVQLAKLQHYGIKTRMMDLTKNALVALYFACISNPTIDGEVLAFSAVPLSIYYPLVNAIADTYRLTGNMLTSMDLFFYRVTKQPYYSGALRPNNPEDPDSEIIFFRNLLKRPYVIEAGKVCERQTNQSGYFLIFPNAIHQHNKEYHGMLGNELVVIDKDDDMVIQRFIIDKEAKPLLLRQMERFGITFDFLFADSVDDVCQSIINEGKKRYPSPT